jgi:hypothetical protein
LRPVHFISGLPRSGSILLAGLLRQNPLFHAGMSGPVGGLFNTLQGEKSGQRRDAGLRSRRCHESDLPVHREADFTHDFDNLSHDADEFDTRAGTPGRHTVRQKIAVRERTSVLPPDVFRRFENDAFWRDPQLGLRGVRVI